MLACPPLTMASFQSIQGCSPPEFGLFLLDTVFRAPDTSPSFVPCLHGREFQEVATFHHFSKLPLKGPGGLDLLPRWRGTHGIPSLLCKAALLLDDLAKLVLQSKETPMGLPIHNLRSHVSKLLIPGPLHESVPSQGSRRLRTKDIDVVMEALTVIV